MLHLVEAPLEMLARQCYYDFSSFVRKEKKYIYLNNIYYSNLGSRNENNHIRWQDAMETAIRPKYRD